MDQIELDLLSKELESDLIETLKSLEKDIEKKSSTIHLDDYEPVQKIGQGTFGEVFKVRHKKTKQHFAVKRLRMEQETEGFPITALREIRILSSLTHENIVTFRGICHKKNTQPKYRHDFYLLFDFCDHDLAGLLSQKVEFSPPIRKSIMKQLLTGLYFLHKNNILHRDLKASNILINKAGVLKIADFGLARFTVASIRPDRPPRYTCRVVTLWYRPPEILLNCRHYGRPVDMWGAGCIMAELWTKYPIMQGEGEVAQLNLIVQLCGSIIPEVWPGVQNLESYNKLDFPKDVKRHVKEKLTPQINCQSAVDLIDKLLVLDPSKRMDADQALSHDYFIEDPQPGDLSVLSKNNVSFLEYLGHRNRHPVNPNQGAPGNRFHNMPGIPGGMPVNNYNRGRPNHMMNMQGQSKMPNQAQGYRQRMHHEQDSSLAYDRIY